MSIHSNKNHVRREAFVTLHRHRDEITKQLGLLADELIGSLIQKDEGNCRFITVDDYLHLPDSLRCNSQEIELIKLKQYVKALTAYYNRNHVFMVHAQVVIKAYIAYIEEANRHHNQYVINGPHETSTGQLYTGIIQK